MAPIKMHNQLTNHHVPPVLSVIFVDFGVEVFWRQLLGFTYFVKPNGSIRFQ
jgi:hypothetical protein